MSEGWQFNRLQFQSTPSVGRATITQKLIVRCLNISIHALRGEGDLDSSIDKGVDRIISIHALRGEGDDRNKQEQTYPRYFNPRPPWGGRQSGQKATGAVRTISIHALRGEGDLKQ